MAAVLSQQDRALAISELERIEQTLIQMSAWADGGSADRERCSIALEDAAKCVMAAAYLIERADRERVAELVHRRMSRGRRAGPLNGPETGLDDLV